VFVAKRLKSFDKCANGVLRCIQEKPGDQACLSKATILCNDEMRGRRFSLESDFRTAIADKCEDAALTPADLFDADGIGYGALAEECAALLGSPVADASDIAECVLAQHECNTERIFDVQEPRAAELIARVRALGANFDEPACLADHGMAGGAADTKTGKAIDKCEAQVKAVASKFVIAKLRGLERCVDALFTCVVTKPGDGTCITKAENLCDKELAKIDDAGLKLPRTINGRCVDVDFAALLAPTGANFEALAGECASVGVPSLNSLTAYETCLFRQQICRSEELLRFEAPRSEELLGTLSPPAALHSGFCPTPD
jgi:hypothetical protein